MLCFIPTAALADRVDALFTKPPEFRCSIEADMVVQGMYAYYFKRTIKEHLLTRAWPIDTDQEMEFVKSRMELGRIIADNWFSAREGPAGVTKKWAETETQKFYESCVDKAHDEVNEPSFKDGRFLDVQNERMQE